jgi:hypothetical protein
MSTSTPSPSPHRDERLQAWRGQAKTLGPVLAAALSRGLMAEIAAGWSAPSPSSPGEAPAQVSGDLAASIRAHQTGEAAYQVGTALAYGGALEIGTARAAARPWLRPALERVRAQARQLAQAALEQIAQNIPAEENQGQKEQEAPNAG